MLEILDPGLACCAACGQLSAAILLEMSESTVLPFDPVKLGEKLEFFVENLKLETENDLKKIAVYLDFRKFSLSNGWTLGNANAQEFLANASKSLRYRQLSLRIE